MSLLLNAILERQLLAINPQDKNNLTDYLEYAVDENKPVQHVVVPSAWINNIRYKGQLQALFEYYYLEALIDVGCIWSPIAAVSFTMMVLTQKRSKKVLMAEFQFDPVDHQLTGEIPNNGELPHLEYTEEFKNFLVKTERALGQGIADDTVCLFTVDFNKLDLSRLQVAFYNPDNQIDIERYKNAKFQSLEKLAEIVNVKKLKNKGVGKVFSWRLMGKCEEGQLPLLETDATSHKLSSGEIVIMPNLEKAFIVPAELVGSYATAHSLVLQVSSNKISPAYLCLYLKSEIAKKYSIRVAIGTVFKRLAISDIKVLPILIPDKSTLNKSQELYEHLQTPQSDIDKVNQLICSRKDNGRLEDSFLLEELEKLKISKRVMIERLIKEDLRELKVCIDKGLYKASMVICGSVLEAVILDWLSESEKHDYYQDENEISLNKALLLLNQLGEMDREVLDAAHNIRRMRNLIHPRNYLKNQGKVTKRECKKLLDELKVVVSAYKSE